MSRIGKQPIQIPQGVEVTIKDMNVMVKGPKGELVQEIRPEIKVEIKDNEILVTEKEDTKKTRAFWGLSRALIANMVHGTTNGFEKQLEIQGVGYKAVMEGENLVLSVGFSHLVNIKCPEGIKFAVEKNIIIITGIDKGKVGQIAAKIRAVRPPEPYKGKGIRYKGEEVRRKAGKKVAAAGE